MKTLDQYYQEKLRQRGQAQELNSRIERLRSEYSERVGDYNKPPEYIREENERP